MLLHSIGTRSVIFFLGIVMLLVAFSGCSQSEDDELSVMIPLQKESFDNFFATFSEQNPDIAFDISAYRGGSPSAYLERRFEVDDLTDIVITSYPPEAEIQKATLLDLSGYDFVNNYKVSVLNNLSVDGNIYILECPSSMRGVAYNKTLFEENGWDVPQSHEEFIALLNRIQAETDLMPIGIQGKYPGTYFTLMSELSHCDFLHTPAGAEWEQEFATGDATSEEGFGTGLSLLQDWLDAGAFDPEQITLGDSTLYEIFVDRGCAMCYVMGSQNGLVELTDASPDEFGVFPIYGRGEDSEFVATTHGLKIGLNKELGEPGNEKKLENALKLMEFLSTEEGQMIFHTGKGDVLPLVGSDSSLSEMFRDVSAVVERGHSAPFLYPGYEDILAPAGEYIKDVCYNGGDLTGVFEVMDTLRQDSLNNVDNYIATVSETLDNDETARFVVNALQAQGYGDFSLISKGRYSEYFDVAGGANGILYEGGIPTEAVNIPITNLGAQSTVTMTLTGAQVEELLNQGRVLTDEEGHTDSFEYIAGGLTVERNSDGTVDSLTFEGEPLDATKTYTVAFSPQDYSEETAALGNPQETGIPWEEAYRAYIIELGTITPEYAE